MTRKHYQAIAEEISKCTLAANEKAIDKRSLVVYLSDMMKKENPNFNRKLFEAACYAD